MRGACCWLKTPSFSAVLMHWKGNWGTHMFENVFALTILLLIGGALVVVVGAMLIAAIDFLQNGGRDD
jgi:hypothetical protein